MLATDIKQYRKEYQKLHQMGPENLALACLISWHRLEWKLWMSETGRGHIHPLSPLLDKVFTHPTHSTGEEQAYINSGETTGK